MAKNDILCKHDITPPCTDSSYAKCPHCSLDLCLEHIIEHQHAVRIQFNEVIDQINEQKAASNNHSAVDKMRVIALAELDNWKATKIETVMTIYNAERTRIENVCQQCITEKSKIQNGMFEELNTASNTIEKKKNIHPRDIQQLEQKLNELNILIKKSQESTNAELTTIVANIKLPETIELEQHLREAQARIDIMKKGYQQKIDARDKKISATELEILRLRQTIHEKDQNIKRPNQKL
jgi:hypothetical protein